MLISVYDEYFRPKIKLIPNTNKVETKENEDNFGSIFDIDDNNENTSDNSKKEDIEQISLFAA